MAASVTRRSALAAALALAVYRSAGADPFPAAIRRAQAADAAYREAGRFAREVQTAGLPLPANWRAYRIGLALARTAARSELQAASTHAHHAPDWRCAGRLLPPPRRGVGRSCRLPRRP